MDYRLNEEEEEYDLGMQAEQSNEMELSDSSESDVFDSDCDFSGSSGVEIVPDKLLKILLNNSRQLLSCLGSNTPLKKPLVQALTKDLSYKEAKFLFGNVVKESTLERYMRDENGDWKGVFALSTHSAAGRKIERSRKKNLKDDARKWIVESSGVTASGKTKTKKSTTMEEFGFYECYLKQNDNGEELLCHETFSKLCKQLHVHFKVGATDFMTCVKCRTLRYEIKRCIESNSSLKKKLQLEKELQQHEQMFVQQKKMYDLHLSRLLSEETITALFVVDYSTFQLMERLKVKVLCVVKIQKDDSGSLRRSYFDLFGLPLTGRPSDGLLFAFELLEREGILDGLQGVHIWSDAGGGDFHNNSAILAFSLFRNRVKDDCSWDLNFFGPRHGWSDCDRHFGSSKVHVQKYLRDIASSDNSENLTVEKLLELQRGISRTTVFDCRKCKVIGAKVTKKWKGISKFLCFELQKDGAVLAHPLTNDEFCKKVQIEGQLEPSEAAESRAKKRRTKAKE
jgi:hypothetical protein